MVGVVNTVSGTQPHARTAAAAKASDDGAFANALESAGTSAGTSAGASSTVQQKQAQEKTQTASTTPSISGASYLLPEGEPESSGKPNIAGFMKAAGCDFDTAASVLSGVIGSNADRRDWTAIMASGNPLAAARAATGAMYNRPASEAGTLTGLGNSNQKVLADSGNFAVLQRTSSEGKPAGTEVALIDGNGNLLRKVGWNAANILSSAQNFGFDTGALSGLADQLDAKNIPYKPGELYAGTGSDHGVDLRDLANGGLGTAYDWRVDPNVGLKGPGAAALLSRNAALAQELGLTANPAVTTGAAAPGTNGGTNGGGTSTAGSGADAFGKAAAAYGKSSPYSSAAAAFEYAWTQVMN